ncbi:uncharacterized protein A4U43_C02F7080 [Asparagus officinalis]|uniref:Uncharacterized protein n=1 Tax=Asparagus officinalis TaxID=4686 RepID=A0A5P1FGL2_ASPOF|nr:uncharacterized protein A4U43_C02F7080 [Asparagus officinalis]
MSPTAARRRDLPLSHQPLPSTSIHLLRLCGPRPSSALPEPSSGLLPFAVKPAASHRCMRRHAPAGWTASNSRAVPPERRALTSFRRLRRQFLDQRMQLHHTLPRRQRNYHCRLPFTLLELPKCTSSSPPAYERRRSSTLPRSTPSDFAVQLDFDPPCQNPFSHCLQPSSVALCASASSLGRTPTRLSSRCYSHRASYLLSFRQRSYVT